MLSFDSPSDLIFFREQAISSAEPRKFDANRAPNRYKGGRCRFVGLIIDSITTNHATRPSPRRRSMMPVSELRLDALVPVPDHVAVEHVDEPVHRDAREAPFMEELLLETAEGPLRGRVVRRTAFRAHRTRQTMLLADADPLGPPVVAATVGMDDRLLPVPERGARVGEHSVGQCRVRAGADRHATGSPSWQSMTGDRYALPAGIENPAGSVIHSRFGRSAWKSLSARFFGALAGSPLYKPCRFALLNRGARPCLAVSLYFVKSVFRV